MEDNPLLLLGFLAIFHIIGAIALGYAVRTLWKKLHGDESASAFAGIFMIVWGSMFGCIPFVFGTDPTLPAWFLPTQFGIWGMAFFLSTFFASSIVRWARPLANVHVILMVLGGIFLIAGIIAASAMWKTNDVVQAGIFLLVFGGIGLLVFVIGLTGLLKKYRN